MVRIRWSLWLPPLASACLTAFLAGVYVERGSMFPSSLLRDVYKTAVVNLRLWEEQAVVQRYRGRDRGRCVQMSEEERKSFNRQRRHYSHPKALCLSDHIPSGDASRGRIEFLAGHELEEPVLIKGELGTYSDYCRGPWGCLAAQHSRLGVVDRVWPFLPDEIQRAGAVSESDYPHERPLGWSLSNGVESFNIARIGHKDLIVVFIFEDTFPGQGGLARIRPNGKPRWHRKDFSHHWPQVVHEDLILVPSRRIRRTSLSYEVGKGHRRRTMHLKCNREIKEDQVNVVNGSGELLEQIPIFDSIAQSNHAGLLASTYNQCNPIHLNFVHMLGDDAAAVAGLVPGDLVVSVRNISAFGILDRRSGRLKRLVRGSFLRQHAVQHWEGARFVMFDNHGTDGNLGPSRLLMVDLGTGEEATLYPTDRTPMNLRLGHSPINGQMDISSDKRRALITDTWNGRGLEIRLADGEVLNVFHSVHDVSHLAGVPKSLAQHPWLFQFHGIYYAEKPATSRVQR